MIFKKIFFGVSIPDNFESNRLILQYCLKLGIIFFTRKFPLGIYPENKSLVMNVFYFD